MFKSKESKTILKADARGFLMKHEGSLARAFDFDVKCR